jgi:hypothetical protein
MATARGSLISAHDSAALVAQLQFGSEHQRTSAAGAFAAMYAYP